MSDQNKQRLIILDSLRGIAALIVCFHHLFIFNNVAFRHIFPASLFNVLAFISNLHLEAVILFFVLSGFCIGLSLRGADLSVKENINDYLYRRFKRILPIYWFSLAFTWLVGLFTLNLNLPDYSLTSLLGNLLFLQTGKSISGSWFMPYGLNGPLWTLSYEMFFYAIFPLVYSINKKHFYYYPAISKIGVLLLISLICGVLKKLFFIPYLAFLSYFIIWLLGYIASQAFLFQKNYDYLFIIACILSLSCSLLSPMWSSSTVSDIANGMAIASVFYFIIKFNQKYSDKLLSYISTPINKLFYFIGRGSYALYAVHFPFLFLLNHHNVPLLIQVVPLSLLFILCCSLMEIWIVRKRLVFFRINYLRKLYFFIFILLVLMVLLISHRNELWFKFLKAAVVTSVSKENSLVMLGDSHVQSFPWKMVGEFRVEKISQAGITSAEINKQISNIKFVSGNLFFICIGSNDLRYGIELNIIENNIRNTLDIIRRYHPESIVLVQEVFPVSNNSIALKSSPELVKALNERLRNICKAQKNIVFLACPNEIIAEYGGKSYLNLLYSNDGLHLNKEGYNVLRRKLAEYLNLSNK